MIVIRTAEDGARALDSPLSLPLKQLLREHLERLAEFEGYSFDELALCIIAQQNDERDELEAASSLRLVQVGDGAATFSIQPELVQQLDHGMALTWIRSDDGYGLVLLVDLSAGTELLLLAACRNALEQLHSRDTD